MRFLALAVLAGFLILEGSSAASLRGLQGERVRRDDGYEEELNDNLQSLLRTLFRTANKQVYAQIVNGLEISNDLTVKRNLVVGTYRQFACEGGETYDRLLVDLRNQVHDYIVFLMDILLTPMTPREPVYLSSLLLEDDPLTWEADCLPDEDLKERLEGQLNLLLSKLHITIRKEIRLAVMEDVSVNGDFKMMKDELLRLFRKTIVGGEGLDDATREFGAKSLEYFRALIRYYLPKADIINEINYGIIDDFIEKVKNIIKDNIDVDKLTTKLKEYLEKIKDSELGRNLLEILKNQGKEALIKYLKSLLRSDIVESDNQESSLKDLWEKIREFFKKAKLELKEKFSKFGEWVKENFKDEFDEDSNVAEKLRAIARKLINHWMEVRKDVFAQALEFLKPYRDELGDLYDELKTIYKKHFQYY